MSETAAPLTLSARGLTRRFGARVAVQDISVELRRGEVLGFLGPNGAGKTTTMRMLTGALAPSAGSIEIGGVDLLERPRAAKARIGYLPEVPPLYRELSVDEQLRFSGRLHGLRGAALEAALEATRARCGLADTGRRLIGALSRGYQQRVGLAQAILHAPEVIVLDEPTAGLDPNQIREIRALIRELGREHSVILSTHILPEAESLCDRVHILHEGRVVFADTIAGLRDSRGGAGLSAGFRNPPAAAELAALPGVAAAEALGGGEFRIVPQPGADPTAAITAAAVERGWGLTLLAPSQHRLEEVFVRLTQGEG